MSKEWKVDKSKFKAGPWSSEPDFTEFRHAGFDCAIVRHGELGHLCGYVGVPNGHPMHGKKFEKLCDIIDSHGGVSYAGKGDKTPMTNKALWWIGFDCAHHGDLVPFILLYNPKQDERDAYRDYEYVTKETKYLAEQLQKIASDHEDKKDKN